MTERARKAGFRLSTVADAFAYQPLSKSNSSDSDTLNVTSRARLFSRSSLSASNEKAFALRDDKRESGPVTSELVSASRDLLFAVATALILADKIVMKRILLVQKKNCVKSNSSVVLHNINRPSCL
ncbi:unnamed protein product [Protopolystoma xenopodis]|uniref:Uncharacterized protein n=1 Tax=Protopolystoma xenopodis TaxID=117903 RepID=A0A3S5AQR0_9PLAT|nr:unnamed protein product [Protopolystoma xenopodis]